MRAWREVQAVTLGLLLLGLAVSQALAESAELEVTVTPRSSSLKTNIEGYIGDLGERDYDALVRYQRRIESQTRKAAQALGYYNPTITTRVFEEPLQVEVVVERGEPVRLRNVRIEVEGPASTQANFRLPNNPKLKPGERLDHGNYEAAKQLILNQASRFGYFKGRFTQHRLTVDPAENWADIDLVYLSGPRYSFGATQFLGDQYFEPSLLERMEPFIDGDPYDSELVAEYYQALQSSGYFANVQVDADPSHTNTTIVPVEVTLERRKPRSMGVGVGFSTDVGPRGRANYTRHWSTPSGHSYGSEMELSQPRQNVSVWYDIPGKKPLTDKWRMAAGYQYEEFAKTETASRLFRIGPEWHSLRPSGWQRILSLKWLHESYYFGDDSGQANMLMPGISYSFLKVDNELDPNNGYRLQFTTAGATRGLLSDTDILYMTGSAKGLITLWEKHRFLGRVQAGGSMTREYQQVPPSLRFFAGGDQSVRGYDYQSLSPRDYLGDRVGGRYLLTSSIEYQYSLTEKWRVAAFVDRGNAFSDFELPNLRTGVGVGVRWVSPVGPLRLDLAKGLSDEGSFQLHFSMGPEL